MRELMSRLVLFRSIYPHEQGISTFLVRYLRTIGFKVETVPISKSRKSLLATRGKGLKSLLFYGYMDTVAIAHPSDWITDPFVLHVKGNNAYGLGAYDMIGGIVAFCEALSHVRGGYMKILLAVDEENILQGA